MPDKKPDRELGVVALCGSSRREKIIIKTKTKDRVAAGLEPLFPSHFDGMLGPPIEESRGPPPASLFLPITDLRTVCVKSFSNCLENVVASCCPVGTLLGNESAPHRKVGRHAFIAMTVIGFFSFLAEDDLVYTDRFQMFVHHVICLFRFFTVVPPGQQSK